MRKNTKNKAWLIKSINQNRETQKMEEFYPTKIKINTNRNKRRKKLNNVSQTTRIANEKLLLLILIIVNWENSIHKRMTINQKIFY